MFRSSLWQSKFTITLVIAGLIAVLGVVGPAKAEQQADHPPINIDIRGGDIVDVLRMLGRAADVDIVINEGVAGEIPSMKLRDKTIEQALWLITQAQGYRCYQVDERTYVVSVAPLTAPRPGQAAPTELTSPFEGQGTPVATPPARDQTLQPQPSPVLTATTPPPAPGVSAPERGSVEVVTERLPLKYEDPRVIALACGGTVVSGRMFSPRELLPARHKPYGNMSGQRAATAQPFAGDLAAPGAPGLGGWGQMYPGGGGLGGGLGGYGGGQRGMGGYGGGMGGYGGGMGGMGGRYGGGGYGGGYGGGGGMGIMLPEGMMPPVALMQQNVLLVHGTQEAIDKFREILAIFDKPAKQVEIAAKFIEIETTQDKAFGIDWFVSNGATEFFNLGFAPGEGISVARFRRGRFEAELRTLISEGRAQVINEPRVTTQNNMPAEVNFSTEIPYFYATITYNQFGQREVDYESDTVSVMQALYVTPRISEDDSIVLDLQPEIDDQVGTVVGPNGETLPIISTQTAYTQVRVPDGDTLVIGGMIRRNETHNIRKTPLLSEIPIIGDLFKSKKTAIRNSELLIFVTPRIIREIPRQ